MNLVDALSTRHWRTKLELAQLMGVTTREVEHAIEQARKAALLPIMSGDRGYRLAETPEEYEANVASRRRRALGQLLTVRGERQFLSRWRDRLGPTQETLRW